MKGIRLDHVDRLPFTSPQQQRESHQHQPAQWQRQQAPGVVDRFQRAQSIHRHAIKYAL